MVVTELAFTEKEFPAPAAAEESNDNATGTPLLTTIGIP
eukprot:CAMPEP_0172321016 /NCGR_PEP_ID=MMETSP1058-20130122/41989_1 /TAXON_ID=83371 /ORGANISM="Detonula confervacea, Strain CCMP 353" /LENGTH=38 /DNA_ID= /DNA_START= /DNA_END= /DNA_ORIENTATION=